MKQSRLWIVESTETHLSVRVEEHDATISVRFRHYARGRAILLIPNEHSEQLGFAQRYEILRRLAAETLGLERVETRTGDPEEFGSFGRSSASHFADLRDDE